MTERITPAVPSGRSVTERSPRSAKVYISLLTTSVDSPTPRANSAVSSNTGSSMCPYPANFARCWKYPRTASNVRDTGGTYSGTPFGAEKGWIFCCFCCSLTPVNPTGSLHLLEEGVGGLLLADGRRRAVAGQDHQLVGKREDPLLQRTHHVLLVRARQIRAADGPGEQHVAGEDDLVAAVRRAQHHAARRMARGVDDLEGQATELDFLAVVQVVDVLRRHHLGDVEHLAQGQARADHRVLQHETIMRA